MDENKCAQLTIEDSYLKVGDALVEAWNLQKDLQQRVYGYDFDKMRKSMKSLKDFIDFNYQADQDEWREFYNALGGVNSFGSAIWKQHKAKHKEALERSFDDLTQEEKLELKFEMVDRFHFFLNVCVAINLKPEELFNMYVAKNKENIERVVRGY